MKDPLTTYVDLALKWNHAAGLFSKQLGREDLETMAAESIEGGRLMGQRPLRVLDVGSGGGIPAIPMKLAMPEKEFLLCEPRRRKAVFLQEAIAVLRLEGVTLFKGRVEELDPQALFDACTIRGLKFDLFAQRLAERLAPGGMSLVFHPKAAREIRTVPSAGWERVTTIPLGQGRIEASLYTLRGR